MLQRHVEKTCLKVMLYSCTVNMYRSDTWKEDIVKLRRIVTRVQTKFSVQRPCKRSCARCVESDLGPKTAIERSGALF